MLGAEKSERNTVEECLSFMSIVVFPCYYIGKMESLVQREEQYSCFSICSPRNKNECLGPTGLKLCVTVSIIAAIGWPMCPGLIYYLKKQRQALVSMYSDDELRPVHCFDHIFWPFRLLENYKFILKRKMDDTLRFHWEYEIQRNLDLPNVNIKDEAIVYILGAGGCGKTSLFEKLLLTADKNARISGNRDESEESATVGFRPVRVKCGAEREVGFIVIYDVPFVNYKKMLERAKEENRISTVLFAFDCRNYHSFLELTSMVDHVQWTYKDWKINYLFVATKCDQLYQNQDDMLDFDKARYSEAKMWLQSHGFCLIETSTMFHNMGIFELKNALLI